MRSNLVFDAFADALAPDPYITIDQWADERRQLPKGASVEPGQYRTSRMPYVKCVMQWLSPQDPSQQVKVIKATQIGFTEAGTNATMYYMDVVPTSQLTIMPSERLAKRHSDKKLTPSLRAMPELAAKIKRGKTKDDIGDTFEKSYPGGSLSIAWSGSSANYRSLSVRYLDLDDVDGFEAYIEGNSLDNAKKRTDGFGSLRKIYINSTPTKKGQSLIEVEYEDSDQCRYYMPCPHCTPKDPDKQTKKNMVVFEKEHFVYGYDKETYTLKGDVKFQCPHCDALIGEEQKWFMMAEEHGARPIPDNPGHQHRGLRVPAYYSPIGFLSWNDIFQELLAAEKAKARGDSSKMETWVNTRDARSYEDEVVSMPPHELGILSHSSFDPWTVPDKTAFLSMAVDVQLDHFWVDVWAHRYGGGSVSIRHQRVETWVDVEEALRTEYRSSDDKPFFVKEGMVDSGYSRDEVYEFCAMHSDVVHPLKGGSGQMTNPWKISTLDTGLKLHTIDVEYFKDMFWAKLMRSVGVMNGEYQSDDIHLTHREAEPYYFEQLVSEHKVTTVDKKGRKKTEWEKIRKKIDNHLFDTAVYNTFIGVKLGIKFLKEGAVKKRRSRVVSRGVRR